MHADGVMTGRAPLEAVGLDGADRFVGSRCQISTEIRTKRAPPIAGGKRTGGGVKSGECNARFISPEVTALKGAGDFDDGFDDDDDDDERRECEENDWRGISLHYSTF